MGYLLWPDLFEGQDCAVTVDITDGPCRGRTVVDLWGKSRNERTVHVLTRVDSDSLLERIVESFLRV